MQLFNKLLALHSTNLSNRNIINNLVETAIASVCYLHSAEKLPFFLHLFAGLIFKITYSGSLWFFALSSAVFKACFLCLDGLNMLKMY